MLKNIRLSVNAKIFDAYRGQGVTYDSAFYVGVQEIFEKYMREHSDLFAYNEDKEFYIKEVYTRL